MLSASSEPLATRYGLVMLDLDGVVYRGPLAIPRVAEDLAATRALGAELAFVTNNAARTPQDVAAHLGRLDVPAVAEEVVTSAQAVAAMIAAQFGAGARVLVLGADGLARALSDAGLHPVLPAEHPAELPAGSGEPAAVVSGYGPDVVWRDIIATAVRIKDGLPWFAANTDLSFPTEAGIAPGHGMLVRLLADFSGVTPQVAGKPEPGLLTETMRRTGRTPALMVGDRTDTDIAAARGVSVDSLLVLTGVTGLPELVRTPPDERPTYLASTLAALHRPMPRCVRDEHGWHSTGWLARVEGGQVQVEPCVEAPSGPASPTRDASAALDGWWRALACAAWEHLDRTGTPAAVTGMVPPAAG